MPKKMWTLDIFGDENIFPARNSRNLLRLLVVSFEDDENAEIVLWNGELLVR